MCIAKSVVSYYNKEGLWMGNDVFEKIQKIIKKTCILRDYPVYYKRCDIDSDEA